MRTGYEGLDQKTLEWYREFYSEETEDFGRPTVKQRLLSYTYIAICTFAWLAFIGSLSTIFLDGIRRMSNLELWILLISGAVSITAGIRSWRRDQRRIRARQQLVLVTEELYRRRDTQR